MSDVVKKATSRAVKIDLPWPHLGPLLTGTEVTTSAQNREQRSSNSSNEEAAHSPTHLKTLQDARLPTTTGDISANVKKMGPLAYETTIPTLSCKLA